MSDCSCSSCSCESASAKPSPLTASKKQPVLTRLWQTQKTEVLLTAISLALFAVALILDWMSTPVAPYAFALTLAVCGGPVFKDAFKSLLKGHGMDETFLMSIASVGAFAIGQFPEAVAVMLFYQVGEIFQSQAVGSSKDAINALMDMRPKTAHLISGPTDQNAGLTLLSSNSTTVNADAVKLGSYILVKPGEQVPLDGIVEHGQSTMNTAFLTGESLPRSVEVGSTVDAGFINGMAPVVIKTTSRFENSAVARILALLEDSSGKKATQDVLIKRFARLYTPLVVAGAVAVGIVVPTLLALPFVGVGSFTFAAYSPWIYKALLFLVVSCPCALVISVPLTYFASIGAAAKEGVLVKGETFIEQLANTTACVFDKTGTLTLGQFAVAGEQHYDAEQPAEITYGLLAAIESHSNHPLAQSISLYANERIEGDLPYVQDVAEASGRGIEALYEGRAVRIGNAQYVNPHNNATDEQLTNAALAQNEGQIIFMSIDGHLVYSIELVDTIKNEAPAAIAELKSYGITTVMLTGDEENAARAVTERIGIDRFAARLLPENKVSEVEEITRENTRGTTVFCGDGINDAPSLARADVGIAMGGLGADAAIEAADAVFTHDNIAALPKLIQLSKKTVRIVKQNIWFALTVKIGILVLGLVGLANMWGAVFADVGVTILLIFNALRVLRTKQ